MIKTILFWVVSTVIGLFSVFWVIGMMTSIRGNIAAGFSFRGAGPEDAEERIPAGFSAFEIPTFNRFVEAALSGNMPGNNKTELPLFPPTDMASFSQPYKDWAPEPYSQLPGPQTPFGASTEVSPPAIIRIMHVMSGLDDIFDMALSNTQPSSIERSFKVMKTKVWFGVAPMSDARWRAKGLDAEDNIEEALAIIEQVIDIFKYLASPDIQGGLRHIHNKVFVEIDVFQDACNAVRTARGEPAPSHSLTKLWQEYTKFHYAHMEKQNRSWVFTHFKTLHQVWKNRFLAKVQSGRILNDHQQTVRIDHYAMMILNKIQDLYIDADLYIRKRMDGFIMPDGTDAHFPGLAADKKEQIRVYAEVEGLRIATMKRAVQEVINARAIRRHAGTPSPFPDFMEAPSMIFDREWGHKILQPEIENPLAREMETWVMNQMDEKIEKFGFVIYRLSYKETDAEWESLITKLEVGINSGWEGVVGADQIRRKATLHWIDGRDEKIPEDDFAAARQDFKTIASTENFPTGLCKTVFLAITPNSTTSFSDARPGDRKGDYRGFLHAVAADFDPTAQSSSSSTRPNFIKSKKLTPGYDGQFKIIDQLLWTDLFAMNAITGVGHTFEDYWALAAQHPWAVYVGPTTGVRRRIWREMKGVIGMLLKAEKERLDGLDGHQT